MAPVATHHFSLPFHPLCQLYPDQPNQHLLPLSNRRMAFPTLISLRAGLQKLDVFLSCHLRWVVPEIFACTVEFRVHTPEKDMGTGHSILATPPAFIRYLFFPIFPNSFEIWCTQPMPSPNLYNSPSEPIRSSIQEGFLRYWGSNCFFALISFRIFCNCKML
jgi:hypothetical protein